MLRETLSERVTVRLPNSQVQVRRVETFEQQCTFVDEGRWL
jgi:hypothetical protein